MHRRHMLAAVATASAGILATSAFSRAAAPEAAMPMGEAEMKHHAETGTVGSLSLATSRVALEKASDAAVKKFAGFETAEQETIADILASMKASPEKAQGALKKPTDTEVEAMLDAPGKDALAALKAKSGADFDKSYVTAQLDGHKKLLVIQEDYLKVGQNREVLDVAKLARGQIKEHIAHLEDIQAMMG